MQRSVAFALVALSFTQGAQAAVLRGLAKQEPDTACGKGFDNLVKGSQDYYRTAAVELWSHPYHTQDNATFETELECWFANMCTTNCGNSFRFVIYRRVVSPRAAPPTAGAPSTS